MMNHNLQKRAAMDAYLPYEGQTVMAEQELPARTWVPTILEETCNGGRILDLQTKLFSERKLFLTGDVTEEMANNFVISLLYLAKSDEPINIYINSPGGLVTSGLVIYDVIQSLDGKVPINMYCIGMAASMGAVILAGGQKGRRFILPHSKVMIHEPLIAGGIGGSASSIKKRADSILETRAITNGILAKHTNKTIEEVNEATAFDNYMNAQEACDFGICDSVCDLFTK